MAPLPRVFFDFTVGGNPLGRVVFELFNDVVPKTAENFRALCTGEKGISSTSNVALHCPVHRVIDGFMIQGGDFTKKNGSGGESIYGGPFEDERLEGEGTQVDKKGLLVMANRGPNTNGSQWFVTLAPAPHLTGKHVVFGRVIFGLEHIEHIGKLQTDGKDRPLSPVVISHCGELELRKPPAKKARSPSVSSASDRSRSRSRSPSRDSRRRKSKSRKDSDTESEDDSDDSRERRRRKRKEKKRDRKDRKERGEKRGKDKDRKPREETEEELDARLEREEKERLEKERLERLEVMKKQLEEERQRIKDSGGVVYKGRGAMRYLDPESHSSRSMPRNFDSRGPDPRARRPPPPHLDGGRGGGGRSRGDQDRWEKGGNSRDGEAARRERLDRDMDRWQHDRSQGGDRIKERARFTSAREQSRSQSPARIGRDRERSVERREASPQLRSESPVRGRTRSRSPAGRSDDSDMVLDVED
ncbi:hypothetical protein I317_05451 [Kwoniella heveanensis CBS 569]|nr:hypothetical protein I317_05451 [Kwoniella heveanensis CBS 569]